jgi:uncharacterized low-complexity protein
MGPVSKEAAMRSALLLSVALGCAAFALPAKAATKAQEAVMGQAIAQNAQRCPPGSWWIPEGYQRKGKWKPAHCSKVVTRSN